MPALSPENIIFHYEKNNSWMYQLIRSEKFFPLSVMLVNTYQLKYQPFTWTLLYKT